MKLDKEIWRLMERKEKAKSDAERYNIQMKIELLQKKKRDNELHN